MEVSFNRTTVISFPDNPDVDTSEMHIEEGSLLLESILCNGNLKFGEINASKFEVTVYNLQDVTGMKIYVYQIDHDDDECIIPLFTGYVDSCKQDIRGHFRKLVAYDAFYSIGNRDVSSWWANFWNSINATKVTLKTLRNSLCSYIGIPYHNTTLFNDEVECTQSAKLSSVSFNTMLSWICELNAVIPHINGTGMIMFVDLTDQLEFDLTDKYDTNDSTFEGYTARAYNVIEVRDSNNTLIASSVGPSAPSTSHPRNVYQIKDNSLVFGIDIENQYGGDFSLFTLTYLLRIGESTVYGYTGLTYIPCDVKMIYTNDYLVLGRKIVTPLGKSFILHTVLSGAIFVDQELIADGEEYIQNADSTPSPEALTALAKTEDLERQIEKDDIIPYHYTNPSAITIQKSLGDTKTTLLDLRVVTQSTSNFIFLATLKFRVTSPDEIESTETVKIDGETHNLTRTVYYSVTTQLWCELNGTLYPTEVEISSSQGESNTATVMFSASNIVENYNNRLKLLVRSRNGITNISANQLHATIICKKATVTDW